MSTLLDVLKTAVGIWVSLHFLTSLAGRVLTPFDPVLLERMYTKIGVPLKDYSPRG